MRIIDLKDIPRIVPEGYLQAWVRAPAHYI